MSGIDAFGTKLKISDGAGTPVFAAVADVTNISGPGLSAESIDVTSHDSASKFREFAPGLKDAGEITMDINYRPDNATHKHGTNGLLKLYADGTTRDMKLEFPTSPVTVWEFTAFITGFEPGAPFDDKLTASVTVKVTGAPTLA